MRKINKTPKQKAILLVALFESIAHPAINCDRQFAKECAKRMINQINKDVFIGIDLSATYGDYWKQVEREIEKI